MMPFYRSKNVEQVQAGFICDPSIMPINHCMGVGYQDSMSKLVGCELIDPMMVKSERGYKRKPLRTQRDLSELKSPILFPSQALM